MKKDDEIYSRIIRAGSITYFIDLMKTSSGEIYLDISESRNIAKDVFKRDNIIIFEEDMKNFKDEVQKVYEKYISLI